MNSQKSHQFASVPLVGLESLEQDFESSASNPEGVKLFEPAPSSIVGDYSNARLSDDDDNLLDRCLRILETDQIVQAKGFDNYVKQQQAEAERLRQMNAVMLGIMCLAVLSLSLIAGWYLVVLW